MHLFFDNVAAHRLHTGAQSSQQRFADLRLDYGGLTTTTNCPALAGPKGDWRGSHMVFITMCNEQFLTKMILRVDRLPQATTPIKSASIDAPTKTWCHSGDRRLDPRWSCICSMSGDISSQLPQELCAALANFGADMNLQRPFDIMHWIVVSLTWVGFSVSLQLV